VRGVLEMTSAQRITAVFAASGLAALRVHRRTAPGGGANTTNVM
jgi:hypothetical protein